MKDNKMPSFDGLIEDLKKLINAHHAAHNGRMFKIAIRALIVGAAVLIMAPLAVANTSSWNWTMNLRYVSGADNGAFHMMNAGLLTNTGRVTVTSRDGGYNPSPNFITIEVRKDQLGPDPLVCTTNITPSSQVGGSVDFSKTCTNTAQGSYYLTVFKNSDDGWNLSGSGTLTT